MLVLETFEIPQRMMMHIIRETICTQSPHMPIASLGRAERVSDVNLMKYDELIGETSRFSTNGEKTATYAQ